LSNEIIIRDDDVLLSSTAHYERSFERFKFVHETVCRSSRLKHVPALLTGEIQEFPDAVEYIQFETKSGRMFPELHGLTHIDYGKLSEQEVSEQLSQAKAWFEETLGYSPTKWYTPWGSSSPAQTAGAKSVGLTATDCSNAIKFKGRYGVPQLMRDGVPLSYFNNRELIIHWWNGMDVERLAAFVEVLNETRPPD
jgi:peptidoglycan/xylan/chitin deacetylase (PgdA/CDA1 family)